MGLLLSGLNRRERTFMNRLLILVLFFAFGCASNKPSVEMTKTPGPLCFKVATLSADGFSIIPYLGRSLAKSMLENKASEFKADTISITSEEGIFHHTVKADGYKCKIAEVKTKKKI